MSDEEIRRALHGLMVAISLTPLPEWSGMGVMRDRERALKMVAEATGFTYESWWQTKKTYIPEEP